MREKEKAAGRTGGWAWPGFVDGDGMSKAETPAPVPGIAEEAVR
jgi:hypothetical protein